MSYCAPIRRKSRFNLVPDDNVSIVQSFLHEHGAALANVAQVLGGPAASGMVFILIESLPGSVRLSKIQRKQLVNLHQLLTLQHTADPDRIESRLSAAIDPASQMVEDICRLSDALELLLQKIAVPDNVFQLKVFDDKHHKREPRRLAISRSARNERPRPKRMVQKIGGAA